jgi:hypothetical protein
MKLLVVALLAVMVTAGSVVAQTKNLGLGVILGEPTGFSLKAHKGEENAIDGAVAWSLSGNNHLHIHADYLRHLTDVITVSKGQLPIYIGVGGRVVLRENAKDWWGVRVPVGLDYYFEGGRFDVFGEIVPIMDVLPDVEFDLEGAIGARFWL